METLSSTQTTLPAQVSIPPFSEENPFLQEQETQAGESESRQQENGDNAVEEITLPSDQETADSEEIEEDNKEDTSNGAKAANEEEKKRLEHEAAESQRKAEWESRQQAKKAVEQETLNRLASMSDEEVMMESMQRVGKDTEKLTRRNMKECVSEFIQTKCLENPAFARTALHPKKNMIHCFQYINRKAREFAEEEMKNNGIKVEPGKLFVYSSDIPDDLCYQWAEDYFTNPSVPEDQEDEEKFEPRPYVGTSKYNSASKKKADKKKKEKKETEKKETENNTGAKKPENKKDSMDGQMSFGDQMSLDLGGQTTPENNDKGGGDQ